MGLCQGTCFVSILTGHSTTKRAQAFEVLVLESMDVTEAVEWLSTASKKKGDAWRTYKPIEVLGCLLVKQGVKQYLGELFVDPVYGSKLEKDDKESVKRKEGSLSTLPVNSVCRSKS